MRPRLLAVVVAASLAFMAGGCAGAPPADRISGPFPDVCGALQSRLSYSARRCAAIVERAIDENGIDSASITESDITWVDDHQARSGMYGVLSVTFHFVDGRVVGHGVMCGGIMGAYDPACGDDAKIGLGAGIDFDIPGSATMPPTPRPEMVADAKPLLVAALDVPIDHAGHYEIAVGTATLADGYLREDSMRVLDVSPVAYWIPSGGLEIRPEIAGRPPVGSRYRDPYDGLEPVSVFLVFDVTRYQSPSVLQVRDIVVR